MSWHTYYQKTKDRSFRKRLVKAIPYVSSYEAGLDLGVGPLREAKFLLDQVFQRVVAVDKEPIVKKEAEHVNLL